MNRVKLGIIGVGVQGGFYANLLTGQAGFPGMPASGIQSESIEVGALCDIDPAVERDLEYYIQTKTNRSQLL